MRTSSKSGSATPRLTIIGALVGIVGGAIGALAAFFGGILGALGGIVLSGIGASLALSALGRSLSPKAPAREAAAPVKSEPAVETKAKPEVKVEIPLDRVDALTSLANANGLAAWFAEKQQRLEEDHKIVVVLVANLDRFEDVEKARGKAVAEAVLVEVAKRVAVFASEEGIAARVSGDEFVCVAVASAEHIEEFTENKAGKLAETIGRPVEMSFGAMWIGGSVGAAHGSPKEGDGILVRARTAFAKARRLGLGRYVVDAES